MDRIGKYEVLSALGRGGFATVFRAYDPHIARPVAIKLLTDSLDSKELARLQSEARAAGRLHHRNVVSIFGLEVEEGKPYLVMELLEGNDLSNSVPPDTQLGVWQAVEIMHQVAEGLQHAHSNRVVHRDVSPQNIWLTPDGTVKIIDFGIAGGFQGGQTLADANRALGTVLFLSPEHLNDSQMELDPRSDIFSYGTVFYQLLAGVNPFAGLDDRETVCNILMREPELLSGIRPDCPPVLAQIVHRALAKDLDLRYQSFQDLLADLDPVMIELRCAQADELLSAAQLDFSEDRLVEARTALGRVLELTPDRKEARQLFEKVKERQRQSAEQAKVQAFLFVAEKHADERKFKDAILSLEKAQRLAPSSDDVTRRLAEACSAHENQERCLRFFKQAEEHRRGGRLEEALVAAEEAAAADPGDVEASGLVEVLRPEVEADRHRRLSEGLAHARQLIKEEQVVAAEALLSSLSAQFADSSPLQLLLTYCRTESSARKRAQVVETAKSEAIRKAAFGEYAQAITVIEQALEHYPDDPDLTRLRAATKAGFAGHSRGETQTRASFDGDSSSRPCACGNVLKAGAKFCDKCGTRVG